MGIYIGHQWEKIVRATELGFDNLSGNIVLKGCKVRIRASNYDPYEELYGGSKGALIEARFTQQQLDQLRIVIGDLSPGNMALGLQSRILIERVAGPALMKILSTEQVPGERVDTRPNRIEFTGLANLLDADKDDGVQNLSRPSFKTGWNLRMWGESPRVPNPSPAEQIAIIGDILNLLPLS